MQARDGADLVDAVIDPMTKTLRLGSCRLHFFLIPAKTCRISALPLRGFQTRMYGNQARRPSPPSLFNTWSPNSLAELCESGCVPPPYVGTEWWWAAVVLALSKRRQREFRVN